MKKTNNWSYNVTMNSDALDLEQDVFTWKNPKKIALSLKNSADKSKRRLTTPFKSAMSMLSFYINRAGKNLPKTTLNILQKAKIELRKLYGKI